MSSPPCVFAPAEAIGRALLYEGYVLYPYRASAAKNRVRWTFGVVAPRAYAEAASERFDMRTEVLVRGGPQTRLDVRLRFLHVLAREVEALAPDGGFLPVSALEAAGELHHGWQEATEREVTCRDLTLTALARAPRREAFSFADAPVLRPIRSPDGEALGRVRRRHDPIAGRLTLSAEPIAEGVYRLAIQLENTSAWRPDHAGESRQPAITRSLVATHTLAAVRHGEFVSLLDPPEALASAAAECRNVGTWPVLVGPEGSGELVLSSPIILYDHPRVAPESPSDLFDGLEIDEILALRILTLTDGEKREMAAADARTRALLERIEALGPGQMAALHGAIRERGRPWRVGDRVRLRPRGRADVFDIVLSGKTATIEAIEQDFEDRLYLAVTIDDDPGRDLGRDGQIGHRFFFRPEEVEPLEGGRP